MLRILSSPRRLCSGLTRRDFLLAGGLGVAGLSLADAPAAPAARPAPDRRPGFGRARNVILLYLFGGPSHLETFDMKPDAPAEVRGPFRPMRSRLPGCDVCEHLPRLARVLDRATVIRSLSHPWNFHGMMWATTGTPESNVPLEESQQNPLHWPYLGSVFTYLHERRHGPQPPGAVPDNLILPWLLSSRRPATYYARPHAAYLGSAHDPLWTEFRGRATRGVVRRTFGDPAEFFDPHRGITPESRFEVASEAEMASGMTLDRLRRRGSHRIGGQKAQVIA